MFLVGVGGIYPAMILKPPGSVVCCCSPILENSLGCSAAAVVFVFPHTLLFSLCFGLVYLSLPISMFIHPFLSCVQFAAKSVKGILHF